jgi:uncharacterized protein YcbK (DUF882 family)
MDLGRPHPPHATTTRRVFLTRCGLTIAGLAVPGAGFAAAPKRSLALMSIHTGEELEIAYFTAGAYLSSALSRINHLMRDYRTGDAIDIDVGLLDLLTAIRAELSTSEAFQVVSGYRSPKTNAWLRRNGHQVSPRSLHMSGKAVDIRVPGVSLTDLRDVGRRLKKGGVGYYASEFVHVDVGRVRYW